MFNRLLVLLIALLFPASALAVDLTACGVLSTASATYVLQNDVSSNGSCFFITAQHVTLNLNGHTVTYDNAAQVGAFNGGFEDSGGWTLSSDASVAAGTYIQPVTLFSGSKSARITTPAADQVSEGTTEVTLAANTMYSIGGWVYNSYTSAVTAYIKIHGTTATASKVGRTYRGFQYIRAEYTTGAVAETVTVDFGISGGAAAASGYIYFDDIRIRRARLGGIVVGPPSWQGASRISDVSSYGDADYADVYGGSVTQGQGESDNSPAVYFAAGTNDWKAHSLTLTADGVTSPALKAYAFIRAQVYSNIINNPMYGLTTRDYFDGAAINNESAGYGSLIHTNTINSGIQTGIRIGQQAGQTQNKVYSNEITLQSSYTNDFAIVASGSEVYLNTITCGTGLNACRGILSGENASGTLIHNNTITVQQLERNQEYNGCELGGAYGIQVEKGNVGTSVYENAVTALADDCDAVAMRFLDESDAINNLIYDNTFTVLASGDGDAQALKVGRWYGESFQVYGNTFTTNRRWIYVDTSGTLDPYLYDNTWATAGTLDDPFYPFKIASWNNIHWSGRFCDNSYGTGDEARFEGEVFREDATWPTVDEGSTFTAEVCSGEPDPPDPPEPPVPTGRTRGSLRLRRH